MSLGEIQPPFGTTKDSITLDDYIAKYNSSPVEELNFLAPRKTITGKFVPDKKENETMNLGTKEQRTDGMKKQAQELIDQAYQRGYKAAKEECAEAVEQLRENYLSDGITQGRNEAWEAARKIMSQNDASWGMKEMKEIFGSSYSTDIMHDLSASEAIEKLRAYEEQKQKEVEEIKVGDEVIFNGTAKAFVLRTIMRGLEDRCFIICSDGSGGECDKLRLKKTGRTFPQIAEVLKKMQEGE